MKTTFIGHMAIRAAEEDDGGKEVRRVFGVASSKGVKRDGRSINMKSLAKAAKLYDRRRGKMFWNHSWAIPIGVREKLDMVDDNLMFQGRIGHGFPVPVPVGPLGMPAMMNVDDLWNIVKQDLTTSLSIAFQADEKPGERDKDGKEGPGEFVVTDLFEVSIVTIPADPEAEFTVMHALEDESYRVALRQYRRELGRSDVYDWRLDGAAAAATVELGEGADSDPDVDPLEILDAGDSEVWERVKEGLDQCRRSLRTTS